MALVAGAGGGIGAAVAARLLAEGAHVVCADLDRDAAARVAAGSSRGRAIGLDVRDEDAWVGAIDAILEAHRRLDVLVNAAGVSAASSLADTSLDEWRHVLAVNLDGAFLGTKHGIRAMRANGGAIVHIGSGSGVRPAAGAAAYSTSKAGLRMLVQAAAKECRDGGLAIRINLVSPAGVKTPLWRSMPFFQALVAEHGSDEAAFAAMTAAGGGPFAEPEAVARVVCFLASDEARHVTGVDLLADDGYTL